MWSGVIMDELGESKGVVLWLLDRLFLFLTNERKRGQTGADENGEKPQIHENHLTGFSPSNRLPIAPYAARPHVPAAEVEVGDHGERDAEPERRTPYVERGCAPCERQHNHDETKYEAMKPAKPSTADNGSELYEDARKREKRYEWN
jgi:hypothetical protein